MKQNAFWVGVGAAVAAVAAIFVVWVWMGGWAEADTKSGSIKETYSSLKSLHATPPIPSGKTGIPSPKDIEAWTAVRTRYVGDYKDVSKVYEDRDVVLEKWFARPNPSPSEFFGPYNDFATAVEKELRAKGIKVGYPSDDRDPSTDGKYGFNWGKPQDWPWDKLSDDEKKSAVRELQKRANICELIKKALLVDGLKVDRMNDVYFFHPLADPTKFPTGHDVRPGAQEGDIKYVNNPLEALSMGNQKFNEFVLPDNGEKADKPENRKFLGRTLTFGMSVTLPYSEVPKLVREILNSKVEMIVNIIGLRVHVPKQNKLSDETTIVIPEGDPEQAKKIAEAKAAREKEIQAVPVQAWITCQVIDYEAANKPAFAK
jgi:hypothetical protein